MNATLLFARLLYFLIFAYLLVGAGFVALALAWRFPSHARRQEDWTSTQIGEALLALLLLWPSALRYHLKRRRR